MVNKNELPDSTNTVLKKRGRKSKKDIYESNLKMQEINNMNIVIQEQITCTDNLENKSNDNNTFKENEKSNENMNDKLNEVIENIIDDNVVIDSDNLTIADKPFAKKRGRKPKGGKIIQQIIPTNNNIEIKPNIILHLKCSIKDLEINNVESEIESYHYNSNKLTYDIINNGASFKNNNFIKPKDIQDVDKDLFNECSNDSDAKYDAPSNNNDTKEIWRKLKVLEHNLHNNNICEQKSACFWCTYEFDNPPIYIPKHYIKESYHVYGSFCSPECATAYLMEETIDSSTKFERYYLINHIYAKIYDYKNNIKPAPNPYYMLEKYYGNLTIQEYRSLLRKERLFLIVDKPLTRILPELHEDNEEFIINNKIIPSNAYKLKKKVQKRETKVNILSDKFGAQQ